MNNENGVAHFVATQRYRRFLREIVRSLRGFPAVRAVTRPSPHLSPPAFSNASRSNGLFAVGPAAHEPQHERAAYVGGPHERPPALELADWISSWLREMSSRRRSARGPCGLGACHRTFAEEELLQEPFHAAAIELDHMAPNAGAATRAKPRKPRNNPRSVYGEARLWPGSEAQR